MTDRNEIEFTIVLVPEDLDENGEPILTPGSRLERELQSRVRDWASQRTGR